MTTGSPAVSADPIPIAVRSIHAMADGDRADFDFLYHPRAVDRENQVQPPSSRVPGSAGFYSTVLWLRAAFADLRYHIHHAVADGNLVAVNSTMNGRHVAPWAVYTDGGEVDTVFPPTNKTFAITQSPLVPDRTRHHRRALGQPRRSRDGQAAWLDPADPGLPVQDGARSTALSVLDLRYGEHVAPAGFGDRARAALGHAPGQPSMEMPAHVSRSEAGQTFLDAALGCASTRGCA